MAASLDEVTQLVRLTLGKRTVRAEDRLIEDLGAESADIVNLAASVEDRFGIQLEESDLPSIRTVADLYDKVQARR